MYHSRSVGSHTLESNTNNTINLDLFDYEIHPIEMTWCLRREPPATRSGLAHTARLGCSGGRVACLFMHSVHTHWVGRRQSSAATWLHRSHQPVAISSQPPVISIGCNWLDFYWLQNLLVYGRKHIESFLNTKRDTFSTDCSCCCWLPVWPWKGWSS